MKIEVEQRPTLQDGRPGAVYLRLVGNDGELKGAVTVWPRFEAQPFSDVFQVEVWKLKHPTEGSRYEGSLDIKVEI